MDLAVVNWHITSFVSILFLSPTAAFLLLYSHFATNAISIPSLNRKRDIGAVDVSDGEAHANKRPRLQSRNISAEDDQRSDVAVVGDQTATSTADRMKLLQDDIAVQRDEIRVLRDTLHRARNRVERFEDLLTESRQRNDVVLAELKHSRQKADRTIAYNGLLEDQMRSVQKQLKDKTAEVSRLKQERSITTLIIPEGIKAEEDYLWEVRALNRQIVDFAHQFVKRDEAAQSISGTLRQKRDYLQDWCVNLLWHDVFAKFVPGLDHRTTDILENIASEIPPTHRTSWKATTFTSIEKLAGPNKFVTTTIARAVQGDDLARKINKETRRCLDDIIESAVRIHFSMAKEGKNTRVLHAAANTPAIYAPAEMEVAQRRRIASEIIPDELSDVGQSKMVASCLSFGFAGSAGVEQKCLVLLKE